MRKLEEFLEINPDLEFNASLALNIIGGKNEITARCWYLEETCNNNCADSTCTSYEDGIKNGAVTVVGNVDC